MQPLISCVLMYKISVMTLSSCFRGEGEMTISDMGLFVPTFPCRGWSYQINMNVLELSNISSHEDLKDVAEIKLSDKTTLRKKLKYHCI